MSLKSSFPEIPLGQVISSNFRHMTKNRLSTHLRLIDNCRRVF